jgi:predicted permease
MAVGELALAQVLLVGAGLLLASFLAVQRVDLGFVPEGRIAADLSLSPDRYLQPRPGGTEDEFRANTEPKRQLVTAVLARLRATPGVRAVAASFTAPLAGAPNRGFSIDDNPDPGGAQGPSADFQVVTPDYFRALGITFIRGRQFEDTDAADRPPVVIVNQALVNRFLPGVDPLGRTITFGGDRRHEIIGVVADARYRDVERPADPTFYVPFDQNDERWPFLSFTAWTDGDAAALGPVFREAMRDADPNQPLSRVRTYDELLATALAPRRFNTLLIGVFALIALLLAAVGTFGVMAFSVASRTRELGVRAALGATPADLRRMVLGQGAWVSLIAVVMGLVVGALATRGMASLLYGVEPDDPYTFGMVAAGLTVVALLATWIPARGATRVDPIAALREQ